MCMGENHAKIILSGDGGQTACEKCSKQEFFRGTLCYGRVRAKVLGQLSYLGIGEEAQKCPTQEFFRGTLCYGKVMVKSRDNRPIGWGGVSREMSH